jgi:hypothetical protein
MSTLSLKYTTAVRSSPMTLQILNKSLGDVRGALIAQRACLSLENTDGRHFLSILSVH